MRLGGGVPLMLSLKRSASHDRVFPHNNIFLFILNSNHG
jgi:hypothetical protein